MYAPYYRVTFSHASLVHCIENAEKNYHTQHVCAQTRAHYCASQAKHTQTHTHNTHTIYACFDPIF